MPPSAIPSDDTPRPIAAAETATERAARRFARGFLLERVRDRLGGNDGLWLEDCLAAVAESDPLVEPRTFDLAFGLVPARLGREPLATAAARECLRRNADACLPGWRPARWRLDEAARALLVTAAGDEAVPTLLERALSDADPDVHVALCRASPLLPPDDATRSVLARAALASNDPALGALAAGLSRCRAALAGGAGARHPSTRARR